MKYINPGIAELLDIDGGTTIESTVYNPTNGVALWQTDVTGGAALAAIPQKIYGLFDIYLPDFSTTNKYSAEVGLYGKYGLHGVRIKKESSYYNVYIVINGQSYKTKTYYSSDKTPDLKYGAVNSIYFYVKAKSVSIEDGEYKLFCNGKQVFSVVNTDPYFDNAYHLVISSNSENMPISNIILSDSDIDLREQITPVPLGTPITDMSSYGDGCYLAENEGEQILQPVDVTSLIADYGGASEVTGIAVAGNPAYKTASGLTQLISISKVNNVQNEHGAKTLRTTATAGVIHCHEVEMSLADMAGMQLGWKAGE